MLFASNPLAGYLLYHLGLRTQEIGRFRDISIVKADGEYRLRLLTRMGGGNRLSYEENISSLKKHPLYLEDRDSKGDNTYAEFDFRMPETLIADLNEHRVNIDDFVDTLSVEEKFQAAIQALKEEDNVRRDERKE